MADLTRREAFAVSLARFGGMGWLTDGDAGAEWGASTRAKSGSYASTSLPASPRRRSQLKGVMPAEPASTDDCWAWKRRIDPGRKFLKSIEQQQPPPEEATQASSSGGGSGGGGGSSPPVAAAASDPESSDEDSDNETYCVAFDIWGAAEKKKSQRLQRSAIPEMLPTVHSESAVEEYKARLQKFYSVNSPEKSSTDVDNVVNYYVASGGNPMSPMSGHHQLDMNLRKTYGVGLAETSSSAANDTASGSPGAPAGALRQEGRQDQPLHRSLTDAIKRADLDDDRDDDDAESSSSYTSYASFSSSGTEDGERVEESVVV